MDPFSPVLKRFFSWEEDCFFQISHNASDCNLNADIESESKSKHSIRNTFNVLLLFYHKEVGDYEVTYQGK